MQNEQYEISIGQISVLIGGIITAVGAFMPWFRRELTANAAAMRAAEDTFTYNGIEVFDGLSLVLAAIVCVFVFIRWESKYVKIGLIIIGGILIIAGFTGIASPPDPDVNSNLIDVTDKPGRGLYITALGGLTIIGGAVMGFVTIEDS